MSQRVVVSETVSPHYSGSKMTLLRSLGIGTLLAIAVSSISPTTSVFINFGPVLHGAGTGIVLAFLIGGVIAILNSLIYAELSSAIPVSGGAYAIALRVFGRPIGLVTAFLYLLLGLGSVPSLILGTSGYLHSLFPGVNEQVFTVAVALLATMIALMRIHSASWLTAAMVIIEFVIILGITLISFFHSVHPMSFALHSYAITSSGIGHSLGGTIVFSMIGVTLFSFSGYELSQNFAEETMNVRRVLAKTILVSAIIAVVVETAAVLGLLLAAKNIGSVYAAEVPSTAIVQSILGPIGATIVLVGVLVATFDCTVAVNMSYIRVFYNAARDGMFTPVFSKWLANLSPTNRVPTRIALIWGCFVLVFSLVGTLSSAIAFTGVVLVLVYALVAVAALVARKKLRQTMAFRMPLWPIPPILVFVCLIYELTQQSPTYLLITLGVIIITMLYYFLVLRPRWPHDAIIDPTETHIENSSRSS